MSTPKALIDDLAAAGVQVGDVWELVNGRTQYRSAIPVLVDWLEHLEERVPAADREQLREGLVRALTVPAARPAAAAALIEQFRSIEDPGGLGRGWAVGNALQVAMDDSVFDDVETIVCDRRFGKARQMVVLGLGRSTDPRAVPLLAELLDDDDVAAHAAMALGKLRAPDARPALERHLQHPRPLVRREVKRALAALG